VTLLWILVGIILAVVVIRPLRRYWNRKTAEAMSPYVLAQGTDEVTWVLSVVGSRREWEELLARKTPQEREELRERERRGYARMMQRFPELRGRHPEPKR
jgi:hypothetical protein